MKKAVVVGGSNGIGLAITNELINQEYYVYILDMVAPNSSDIISTGSHTYYPCNLLDYDDTIFYQLSKDNDVKLLMITAGFGRVSDFEYLHPAEIDRIMRVNATANILVVRYFYQRIKSSDDFYCGIMGSIAGLISSPAFSVYAASKAAVYRFVESVNIELEVSGYKNRILNVSPGSIKGTKFNGGNNDFTLTRELASQIVNRLHFRETLYIPEYEEIYKGVLERYHTDPHEYGIYSYQYKRTANRIVNENLACVGYLSGTFDLFHVGHLNLIRRAKQQCDYLIVGVHPDASHKGKLTFVPVEERMQIVGACKYVDRVVPSCPEDSEAWDRYHYDKLFVGSDYKGTERFKRYEEYFQDKGVEIVYFPYTQGTSSTQLRQVVSDQSKEK